MPNTDHNELGKDEAKVSRAIKLLEEKTQEINKTMLEIKKLCNPNLKWVSSTITNYNRVIIGLQKILTKIKPTLNLRFLYTDSGNFRIYYINSPNGDFYCLINDRNAIRNKENLFLCGSDLEPNMLINWDCVNYIEPPGKTFYFEVKTREFLIDHFPEKISK